MTLNTRQEQVLKALREHLATLPRGYRVPVSSLVEAGRLSDTGNIGWGLTLASLERRGLVESTYPSVESAGVPKIWRIL